MAKSELKKAKDKAWGEFSKFIRVRDCLRTTNSLESGVCISCPREIPYKGSQAGHFIAGRTNAILLDEDLVHLQCYHCNIGLGGNYVEYFVAMEQLYSREEIDILRSRKNLTLKVNLSDWLSMADYWKKRTQVLIALYEIDKYSPKLTDKLSLKKTFVNEPIEKAPA